MKAEEFKARFKEEADKRLRPGMFAHQHIEEVVKIMLDLLAEAVEDATEKKPK